MPDAEYHTPGSEILGQDVPSGEQVITIDDLLISHIFLADIDEALSHFEVRSKYSRMQGQKLAQTFDNHVMREIINAAQSSAPITGENGGLQIYNDNFDSTTDADRLAAWVDALFTAAQNFDDKFVTGKRWCILKPADYYFFVRAVAENGFSAIHRDYGGEGSFADGKVIKIAGITLVPSPMLPTADYTTDTYHKVDCTNTAGIVFTEDAVGTVKLMDLSLQAEWDIRRQGTLMVAR